MTNVCKGDWINVLGEFKPFSTPSNNLPGPSSTITINSYANLLILHPDLLLSATTIANAPSCARKPLVSLMLSSNAPSPPASAGTSRNCPGDVVVWGNFLHEVVQESLAARTWDKQSIENRIDSVIRSPEALGQLVKLGVGIEKARFEVRARAGGLQRFAERFVGSDVKVCLVDF
jgi:DNA replication ATP-dependent helicase/nuclease Dna2